MENNEVEQGKEQQAAELVTLCKTSYHYWRFWVNDLLRGTGAKFKKGKKCWKGDVVIPKAEYDNGLMLLNQYKANNPNIKDIWQ